MTKINKAEIVLRCQDKSQFLVHQTRVEKEFNQNNVSRGEFCFLENECREVSWALKLQIDPIIFFDVKQKIVTLRTTFPLTNLMEDDGCKYITWPKGREIRMTFKISLLL